jgi:hypothetical protein
VQLARRAIEAYAAVPEPVHRAADETLKRPAAAESLVESIAMGLASCGWTRFG